MLWNTVTVSLREYLKIKLTINMDFIFSKYFSRVTGRLSFLMTSCLSKLKKTNKNWKRFLPLSMWSSIKKETSNYGLFFCWKHLLIITQLIKWWCQETRLIFLVNLQDLCLLNIKLRKKLKSSLQNLKVYLSVEILLLLQSSKVRLKNF